MLSTVTSVPVRSYTGHYQHTLSGLVLAPYRAYDPDLGRWISEDPIAEDGGLNLYGYVGNGVIGAWDPLGFCKQFEDEIDQIDDKLKKLQKDQNDILEWSSYLEDKQAYDAIGDQIKQLEEIAKEMDKLLDARIKAKAALVECRKKEAEQEAGENEVLKESAKAVGEAAAWTWLISELTRLIPIRNLIPIP